MLFENDNRVWPSGKAADFGSAIPGSNPGTRASFHKVVTVQAVVVCIVHIFPNKKLTEKGLYVLL